MDNTKSSSIVAAYSMLMDQYEIKLNSVSYKMMGILQTFVERRGVI